MRIQCKPNPENSGFRSKPVCDASAPLPLHDLTRLSCLENGAALVFDSTATPKAAILLALSEILLRSPLF